MACNIKYEEIIFSIQKMSRFNNTEYYVFIGETNNEIDNILKKLEKRDNIQSNEVKILKAKYPKYYEIWINVVKKKIKIKFINSKIQIDDTINEIRNKIFVYLSDEKNNNFLLPKNQELWLEKVNGVMEIIGYYYENIKTKEKEFTIPHIYKPYDDIFDEKLVKKNTSENNMLIYDLLQNNIFKKNIIYLSDVLEEYAFLKQEKKILNNTSMNKYFKKYWPYFNLKKDTETKNNFILMQQYYTKENYIFNLINSKDADKNINKDYFGSCNIITINLITKSDENKNDILVKPYLDLYQIFNYIKNNMIDENTPFLKYYENMFDSPFYIISKKAVDNKILERKMVEHWIGIKKIQRLNTGIKVQRFIKEYNGVRRYNVIDIKKDGNLVMNISFDNQNNANFEDVKYSIDNFKNFINEINKNRIIKKANEIKKIEPVDIEIIDNEIKFKKNTKMINTNIIIPLKLNEPLDFVKLSEFAKKFPYFLIEIPNKKNSENGIYLRYKRVSGFANMNEILFKIDELKELYGDDISIIIKILEKKYQKSYEEIKKYLLEWEKKYSSSKTSKISSEYKRGILIIINNDNISCKGITHVYQIKLLYNFLTTFLTLFVDYNNFIKNKSFKKIFSSDINFIENAYTKNNNLDITINNMYNNYNNLYLNNNLLNSAISELHNNALIEGIDAEIDEENKLNNIYNKPNTTGFATDNEIGTDIKLKCDDAIPDKDTCKDYCNDASYFIRRLQRYDPKLFIIKNVKKTEQLNQYSRKVNPESQPVPLYYDPDKNNKIKKGAYSYSIEYSSDPSLKRWYICPKIWCPICELPISENEIDIKTIRSRITEVKSKTICKTVLCPYGTHQAIMKTDTEIYPGFLSKSYHPSGLCMPCCYKKSHKNPKSTFYKHLLKCTGDEVENENIKEGEIYILGKSIPIEINRYGILPIEITRILKTNLETGYLKYNSGYLRKGIKQIKNNSFLSCIADILSCDKNNKKMELFKIKSILVDKLNEDIFRSIYSGNLPNIFHNPVEKLSPLDNFKNYLLNDKVEINHKYLWDFLQRKNILFEDGINIFIFENNTLLCPKGENINGFYDLNKKNILIIKFKDYYEPIYHLEGNGKTSIKKCIFNNESEEIHKLFEISLKHCKQNAERDIDWVSVLKDNIKKYDLDIDNITIELGYTLYDVLNQLLNNTKNKKLSAKYLPKLQYVDSYNKVFGLELENGLYLPIAPSKLITQLKYKIIYNLDDIHKLDLIDTINYTNEISKKTELKYTITNKILDLKTNKNIVAIINQFNRYIPINPNLNKDKKMKISSFKYYSDINEALTNKIEQTDKRLELMNKKKYEDETYIRLKFELSKFLQIKENINFKNKILEIINSNNKDISINRNSMFSIVNTIYNKLLTVKGKDIDYDNYNTLNERVPCFLKTRNSKFDCNDDPHCTMVKSDCKLYINEKNILNDKLKINNYTYYLSKIVDELLRFKINRDEILDDNIPNIINKELIIDNQEYITIFSNNYNEITNKIDKLFFDNNGIFIDTRNLYEDISTKQFAFKKEQYIKSKFDLIKNNKTEELTIYWKKILGNKFKIKINDINSIFDILLLILNLNDFKNNKNTVITNIILKNKMIELIKKMDQEEVLELYKKKSDKVFLYITTIELLIDEILNDNYNGSEAELIFFAKIYNINVIILDKRIKKNMIGYDIIKSENYKNNYFIILLKTTENNKNSYNIIYFKNKFMFKLEELTQMSPKLINKLFAE